MLPCGIWKILYDLRIHAASSWGGIDDEFSSRGGTKSHIFIWARSRQVRGQEQESHKPCFRHRTVAVVQTTHSNATVVHVSGLWCQKRHHTCDYDDHMFHCWGHRQERWWHGRRRLPPRLRAAVIFPTARLLQEAEMTKLRQKATRHEAVCILNLNSMLLHYSH